MHPFLRHLNYCLQFILPVCFPLSPFSRFSLSTRLSSSLTSISLLLLFRCLGVSPGTSPLPPVSGCAPPRTLVSSFPRAVGSLCSPSRRRLPLSSPPSPPPPGRLPPPAPRRTSSLSPVGRLTNHFKGSRTLKDKTKLQHMVQSPDVCLSSSSAPPPPPSRGTLETLLVAAFSARPVPLPHLQVQRRVRSSLIFFYVFCSPGLPF